MGLRLYVYASNDEPIWNAPTHSQLLPKDEDLLQHAYSVVGNVHWYINDREPVRVVYTADAVAVGFVFQMIPGHKYRHVLASLFELLPLADDLLGVAVM